MCKEGRFMHHAYRWEVERYGKHADGQEAEHVLHGLVLLLDAVCSKLKDIRWHQEDNSRTMTQQHTSIVSSMVMLANTGSTKYGSEAVRSGNHNAPPFLSPST